MTDLRKAAEMALEFVDWLCGDDHSVKPKNKALDVREALRQALAQPEQEPVAWMLHYTNEEWMPMRETFYTKDHMEFHKSHNEVYRGLKCQVTPLYTAPPKREWVGLTEDEKQFFKAMGFSGIDIVEAKLKEKNNG